MLKIATTLIAVAAMLTACAPASQHADEVSARPQDRLTVGTVQREIRVGMTGAEVATVLGSPNIVTSTAKGGETWIYDRISTSRAYSQSSGGVNVLFLGGAGASAGASATTQRTLTVIIEYDTTRRVSDFSYRQSSF